MKTTLFSLLLMGLTAGGSTAGELLLFEEFRDPAATAKNWTSYYHFPKAGEEHTFIEKKQIQFPEGVVQLQSFTNLFTTRDDFGKIQIDFEMRAIDNVVKDGKSLGFIGIQVRRGNVPLRPKAPDFVDRPFRLICKIGRPIPHWDIPGTITETDLGLSQSKMPVLELNRWYTVRLVCADRVTIYIDGIEIGQTPPGKKMNETGAIALWSVNAVAQFRNILVRGLDEEPEK